MVSLADLTDKKLSGSNITDTIHEWYDNVINWFIDIGISIKDFFINMPLWLQLLLIIILFGITYFAIWYLWRNRDQIPLFYR